jgi:hypothetical protein
VGAVDWTGDGPQIQNFGAGGAGSIVDGNHIDLCLLPPPAGQGQAQPGDEDKVSQLEPHGLAHHDPAIQAAV